MSCSEARELLSLYMDNMLDDEERMEVEKHLLTCDECKKELDSLVFVAKILKDLPEVELPELFDDRLREKLLLANKLTKKKKWSRYSSFAAIFLVGIFSVAMYNNMNTDLTKNPAAIDPAATMMNMTTEQEPPVTEEDESPDQRLMTKAAGEDNAADSLDTSPAEAGQAPEMLTKSVLTDEEINPYIKLLDEIYKDQKYILIDWTLEPNQGYIINIELESIDEAGTISYERLRYRGQDGKLCKIE